VGATAYTGDWGSCKTLGVTRRLSDALKAGKLAASNYGFIDGEHFFSVGGLASILARQQRVPYAERKWLVIGIDEAAVLFPNRGPSKFPPVLDLVCNAARHFKVELVYTTPNLSRVDVNLRLATSRVVRCHGWFYKKVEHDDFGTITRPRLTTFSERSYCDDKLGEVLDRRWVRWRRLEPYTALYDSFFMSDAVASELERIAKQKDASMGWGDAAGPPTVNVSVAAPRTSAGRR
jgi:hypothetical protein